MDFIDLPGAAGATYRFRRWPETDYHPPMAGNFVVVDASNTPLLIGVTDDLSLVKQRQLPEGALFTRLNVSRATRTQEHAELAQAYPEAEIVEG